MQIAICQRMKERSLINIVLSLLFVAVFSVPALHASEKDHAAEKPWKGTLLDGRIINYDDLKKIIKEHKKWIDSHFKKGKAANLWEADLSGVNMSRLDLRGARLWRTNLTNATLLGTNLARADLTEAILTNANLMDTNLDNTIFQIKVGCLPYIPSAALAYNLSKLKYVESPHALVELRKAFKDFGLRKQEREITYAIKHSGLMNARYKGNLITKIEVILGRFFFDLTCKWGMAPERPLFILVGLIFVFTLPYAQAISGDIYGKVKTDGIWKVWITGRMREDLGVEEPKKILDSLNASFCFKMGFYFSVLSAFNIGWRELNIGNWISRIQPYEYRLQASGWARSISGIQSLISLYLLALSILTYFGNPFDSF